MLTSCTFKANHNTITQAFDGDLKLKPNWKRELIDYDTRHPVRLLLPLSQYKVCCIVRRGLGIKLIFCSILRAHMEYVVRSQHIGNITRYPITTAIKTPLNRIQK